VKALAEMDSFSYEKPTIRATDARIIGLMWTYPVDSRVLRILNASTFRFCIISHSKCYFM